jgi:sulfoxide reductase heme-binding subunit YedZ
MAGLYLWLLAFRLLPKRAQRGPAMLAAMTGLATLAAALTALIEALYYQLRVGAPFARVLEANLGFDIGASAAAIVLAVTLGIVAIGAMRMVAAVIARHPRPVSRELAPARRG